MRLSRSRHKCSCLPSSEDCKVEIKGLHQHQASWRNTKNWRLHQYTWGERQPQDNKSYPRSLDSSRPQFAIWKLSNSQRNFSGILDIPNPASLTNAPTRFRQDTFGNLNSSAANFSKWRRSTPSARASLCCNSDYHRWVEEQPLRPNSTLVSAPLTTTLRNLGTRFCLRGVEL
jgi:hypothetical protein